MNRVPQPERVKTLSQSIREVGVLQPITVRPVGDELEIVLGEYRWAACTEIDPLYPVPCFVRQMDDRTAAKLMAVENFQRTELDPVDQSMAIRNMKESGWTLDEIGETLGLSPRTVSRLLAVTRLPDEALPWVREGLLALEVCEQIVSLPAEQQLDAARDCAKPVTAAQALPRDEAKKLLKRKYFDPLEQEREWNEKRTMVENEFTPAKWLPYAEAVEVDADRAWVKAMSRAGWWDRAPHLKDDENFPTWLELARKHGAEQVIARAYDGSAYVAVEVEKIMDAERAASKPGECIFVNHDDDEEEEEETEEEIRAQEEAKRERAERVAQAMKEREKILDRLLKGKIEKLAQIELAVRVGMDLVAGEMLPSEAVGMVLGVETEERAWPELEEELKAKAREYLCGKGNAMELLGRLVVASEVANIHMPSTLALMLVGSGATDEEESPGIASFLPKSHSDEEEDEA